MRFPIQTDDKRRRAPPLPKVDRKPLERTSPSGLYYGCGQNWNTSDFINAESLHMASSRMKKIVLGSMVVAGLVTLAALVDLIAGIPFSGGENRQLLMDIMFICSGGLVLYMGWDTIREMT